MVSIMKMYACSSTIRMWKIDQPRPSSEPKIVPVSPVAAHIQSSKNRISPAYMLPKRRSECDSVFEMYSTIWKRKLAGISSGCEPNGAKNNSCSQPPRPLTETEKTMVSTSTEIESPKVVLTSAVGT